MEKITPVLPLNLATTDFAAVKENRSPQWGFWFTSHSNGFRCSSLRDVAQQCVRCSLCSPVCLASPLWFDGKRKRHTVYFRSWFPLPFCVPPFISLLWCCIWQINNVILNQGLLGAEVITSSIIWPHLLLCCKQLWLGTTGKKMPKTYTLMHAHTFKDTKTEKDTWTPAV